MHQPPPPNPTPPTSATCFVTSRGPEKFFLYEFIANKQTSVDVDKWDYMLRSSPRLGRLLLGKWRKFCHFLSWESIPQMYPLICSTALNNLYTAAIE